MKLKVAAVQLNSCNNKEENLSAAEALIDEAAMCGARFVGLPELFNYAGVDDEEARANAEEIPGYTIERLMAKARQHRLYLHCGSITERSAGSPRFFNTTVVLNPEGDIIARYRKIHLFDVDFGGDLKYMESDSMAPGKDIVTLQADGVCIGLAICYDLRFPELFRILALRGAQVIYLPAGFTMHTGKDHWHLLVRARAVENQVFMVAPNQVGSYAPGRVTYGRSLIVDPWGLVLAQAHDRPCVITAELDFDVLEKVRRELPSLANRRPEAYVWD